jgi:soluble lytic murein transglycosylase-like protein
MWLALSSSAMACVPTPDPAQVFTPEVSAKFHLAKRLCADATPEALQGALEEAGPSLSSLTRANEPGDERTRETPQPRPAQPQVDADARAVRRMPVSMSKPGRGALARALSLDPHVTTVAQAYQIDPLLLHAIAHVESRHNASAVSHAGALGLMQVMPATAQRFGVTAPRSQLLDPRTSLEVSSAYLKNLQGRFKNDLTLVIAAYNAGEGAVEKYGRKVPPYKETRGYVRDVLAQYHLLLSARATALAHQGTRVQ